MKKLIICILILCLSLTACKKESNLFMAYNAPSSYINADVGSYVKASVGDFMSNDLAVVLKENEVLDPNISAEASLKFNASSGDIVYAKNVYERIYPASTTKILTALVCLKYGNLSDEVTIRQDNGGITIPGAKLCNYKAGDIVSLETLLGSLLVYSGNDAAIAIAEHIAGSEEAFVELMNKEAALIGATNTHFVNPHGLHDPLHYTTAYDLYLIFKACLTYDTFREIIKMPAYIANYENAVGDKKTIRFETTNLYLLGKEKMPDGVTVFGGKSGSTGSAGDCLIIYSEDSLGDGYITEVFKATSKVDLYRQISYLLSYKN